jgi:hypothetical protein
LVFWRGHTSVWQSLFVFPGGFATGVAQSAVFVALAASVDTRDMAVASSGFYLAGSIGSVAGIASASAIFTARLRAELPRALSRIDVPNRQEVRWAHHAPEEISLNTRGRSYVTAFLISPLSKA